MTALVQECARGLSLDALTSSHPIEVEVLNSAQVNEIFDAISYCKGASVIRMLVTFLGRLLRGEWLRALLGRLTSLLWGLRPLLFAAPGLR